MREIEKLRLHGAILHQVEPGPSGLKLSGRELPLDSSPDLADFLAGHILNGLRDSQTKAARWPRSASDDVRATCEALLGGTVDLVTASRRLATALHLAIGDDRRIARGALAVATYCDASRSERDAERFVALVKLDPSGVFRPEWRTDDRGTTYLTATELPDALPTLREKLQKCAFVRETRPADRYSLLVLDRQVADISAKFFMEGFLRAEAAFDDKALTEGLYRAVVTARRRLEDTLSLDRLMGLDDAIRGAFAATSVDLADWLPTLPEAERNAIDEEVRSRELDRAFELHPAAQARLTQKVRYRGDSGLLVQVDSDAFEDMVTVEEIADQVPRRFRVIIETSKWELA